MARTKQTARKTLIPAVRARTMGVGGIGKVGCKRIAQSSRPAGSDSDSDSGSSDNFVNTQQFSVKFDDQEKCEAAAVETALFMCKNC